MKLKKHFSKIKNEKKRLKNEKKRLKNEKKNINNINTLKSGITKIETKYSLAIRKEKLKKLKNG